LLGEQKMVEYITGVDWMVSTAGVGLAVISALAAALYPIWRACGIQPAAQLKSL